jgi:peroxiredoxin
VNFVSEIQTPQSNKKTKILALFLIGAGLIVLGGLALVILPRPGTGASAGYKSAIPVEVDYPAPQVSLTDLEGDPASLEDYRGQWVLVNHWAFWCTPCRDELPVLQKYYQDHKEQNFAIIGIESEGEYEDVAYHAKLYRLTFPVWQDPQGSAAREFLVGAFPTSFVIDPNGQVRLGWAGPISREMLEQYITPLLEN